MSIGLMEENPFFVIALADAVLTFIFRESTLSDI
jgi:hypothetical protein